MLRYSRNDLFCPLLTNTSIYYLTFLVHGIAQIHVKA